AARRRPGSRRAARAPAATSLAGDRLDLDAQVDGHAEAVGLAGIHAELLAVDRGVDVGAAVLALEHRVRDALELLDVERDRVGLAVHLQRADRLGRRPVGKALQRAL